MKRALATLLIIGLTACGQEAPKPVAKATPTPAPAAQPAPPPPAAKAPEAQKSDPNKELAARVKRAVEEEGKLAGIDVTASDGKVTLWGTTGNAAERQRAAGIASKVDGVKSVENNLKVVKGS
jgi:CubicO group peptidase (beta-lactamase class C family)